MLCSYLLLRPFIVSLRKLLSIYITMKYVHSANISELMSPVSISERFYQKSVNFAIYFNTNGRESVEITDALKWARRAMNTKYFNISAWENRNKTSKNIIKEIHGVGQYLNMDGVMNVWMKPGTTSHQCFPSYCTIPEIPVARQNHYRWVMSSSVCELLEPQHALYHRLLQDCRSNTINLVKNVTKPLGHDEQDVLYKTMARSSKVSLLLVKQALIDETTGCLSAGDNVYIHLQCHMGEKLIVTDVKDLTQPCQVYDEVFVITQYWSSAYFHWLIEALPRLILYRDFLLKYPQIKIHIGKPSVFINSSLSMLGIEKGRVIWGPAQASLAYVPPGWRLRLCSLHCNPNPFQFFH